MACLSGYLEGAGCSEALGASQRFRETSTPAQKSKSRTLSPAFILRHREKFRN
jgi:hypothetical protein